MVNGNDLQTGVTCSFHLFIYLFVFQAVRQLGLFHGYSFAPCIQEGFVLAAGHHCVSGSCKDVCGFTATLLQTPGLYFYYDCCCEDILKILCFSLLMFLLMFQGVGRYWQDMPG